MLWERCLGVWGARGRGQVAAGVDLEPNPCKFIGGLSLKKWTSEVGQEGCGPTQRAVEGLGGGSLLLNNPGSGFGGGGRGFNALGGVSARAEGWLGAIRPCRVFKLKGRTFAPEVLGGAPNGSGRSRPWF